jgi:hypothetical protein
MIIGNIKNLTGGRKRMPRKGIPRKRIPRKLMGRTQAKKRIFR